MIWAKVVGRQAFICDAWFSDRRTHSETRQGWARIRYEECIVTAMALYQLPGVAFPQPSPPSSSPPPEMPKAQCLQAPVEWPRGDDPGPIQELSLARAVGCYHVVSGWWPTSSVSWQSSPASQAAIVPLQTATVAGSPHPTLSPISEFCWGSRVRLLDSKDIIPRLTAGRQGCPQSSGMQTAVVRRLGGY